MDLRQLLTSLRQLLTSLTSQLLTQIATYQSIPIVIVEPRSLVRDIMHFVVIVHIGCIQLPIKNVLLIFIECSSGLVFVINLCDFYAVFAVIGLPVTVEIAAFVVCWGICPVSGHA